jgi:hypothetical protein
VPEQANFAIMATISGIKNRAGTGEPGRACSGVLGTSLKPGAIAFGFSDLSVAVIPAEAGIQGPVTGFGALDSRFRGNERVVCVKFSKLVVCG